VNDTIMTLSGGLQSQIRPTRSSTLLKCEVFVVTRGSLNIYIAEQRAPKRTTIPVK